MIERADGKLGAQRALWLAELSEALDEAQRLLLQLGVGSADAREVTELYLRIEGARLAVQSLRPRGSTGSGNVSDPKWTDPLPWGRGPQNPA